MSALLLLTLLATASEPVPPPISAGGDLAERAERLAALRAETQALADALRQAQEQTRARSQGLEAQQLELDLAVQREELRARQLEAAAQARLSRAEQDQELEESLRPVVLDGLTDLRRHLEAGLPYRLEERLAALQELVDAVGRGDLLPSRALGRWWAQVEDERRIARENAVDRQVILLDGAEHLADVARLGGVALYWRLNDGRVGVYQRQGPTWVAQPIEGRTEVRAVEALFENLKKGLRTGWWVLPGLPTLQEP